MMKKMTAIITIILTVLAFGSAMTLAQITIKLPDIKIKKPDTDNTKIKNTDAVKTTDQTGETIKPDVKTRDSKLIYKPQRPTNAPVFLRNSVYVKTAVTNEHWKMPGQENYSSWVPQMRFSQYYDNERELGYTVEYFNPDGSSWFSEKLESVGRNAEETVEYQSSNPFANGIIDTKSTAAVGVFGFKITNSETKAVLFEGKFKVGKFSRANRPQEKNKADFYVEHDWLLPFGMIGFHHSLDDVGGMMPLISVWLKGDVAASELEGRLFYKGRQIASTKDDDGASGVSDYDERMSEYAPAFAPEKRWKRWQFQFGNFRVDNGGTFNREYYPNALYSDKNPGDYTVKIYRNGAEIRELSFTVGADGRFVAPAWSSQIPLPYYRLIIPVKVLGAEKWDASSWKTDAFYGNPLSGFSVQ